jgi:hypothetical protein
VKQWGIVFINGINGGICSTADETVVIGLLALSSTMVAFCSNEPKLVPSKHKEDKDDDDNEWEDDIGLLKRVVEQ